MRCDPLRVRRIVLQITICILLFVVAQAGLAPAPAFGENPSKKSKPYALIFGTVWDVQNRPVPGVTVKIQREGDKKPKWTLMSDRRGEFAQRVPPGKADYLVYAEVKGKKGTQGSTKVHIEGDERADIGLHISE